MKIYWKSEKEHQKYWKERKIDWNTSYLQTYNHPHRNLISKVLGNLNWISLFEIGCGPGANLVNIMTHFKGKQVGGIDVNPEAIELANKTFDGGYFDVGTADDLMMSDNSVDVVLTDMTLIYVGDIDKVMKEIKRISRKYVLLCELHEPNWIKRLLFRLKTGYYAHNYKTLLQKHGFEDIMLVKIPPSAWEGGEPQKTRGYIILAKTPTRK